MRASSQRTRAALFSYTNAQPRDFRAPEVA